MENNYKIFIDELNADDFNINNIINTIEKAYNAGFEQADIRWRNAVQKHVVETLNMPAQKVFCPIYTIFSQQDDYIKNMHRLMSIKDI